MDIYSMSDHAIAQAIGNSMESHRLRQNMKQTDLAKRVMLSRSTVQTLENQGNGKISSLISILRELGELDRIMALVQPPELSPIQLLKSSTKGRQRASGSESPIETPQESDW